MRSSDNKKIDLSVVFPCLNEGKTIVECIKRVRVSLATIEGLRVEIVVADNGSSDDSVKRAIEQGVRVVNVAPMGYGAALRGGISAAKGEYVLFVDADGTYCYEDAAKLYLTTRKAEAVMGIAARSGPKLERGSMPLLHRYLGTPILSFLLRLFYGGKQMDCNSGFRCIRKSSFEKWGLLSSGMEFASELSIKALKSGESVVEIQSGLKKVTDPKQSKLATWRDGMRHLMTIFSRKPVFFERLGMYMILLSSLIQLLAMFLGPVSIGSLEIFDVHSRLVLFVAGLFGCQLYGVSLLLYFREKDPPFFRTTDWLMGLGAEILLMILCVLGLILLIGVGEWSLYGQCKGSTALIRPMD